MNVVLSAAEAGDIMELCLEIQHGARLIYDYGIFLRNSKKQICQQILTGFPANPFFSL